LERARGVGLRISGLLERARGALSIVPIGCRAEDFRFVGARTWCVVEEERWYVT